MRTFAIATLGIAFPLAVAYSGIDGRTAAITFAIITALGLLCLVATFEFSRKAFRAIRDFLKNPLHQALLTSSIAVACGLGAVLLWSNNEPVQFLLVAVAVVCVNWWLHLLTRTATGQALVREEEKAHGSQQKIDELEAANEVLLGRLAELQSSSARLAHVAEENERTRAVIRHVTNVLLGIEEAKEGRGGITETGVDVWIEHRCLLTTRDVFEAVAGRPDGFQIELGIIRTSNGVIHVEMSAGDYLDRLREKGGCPEFGSIEELLDRKARHGGFDDSFAVEFPFDGEPHHMIALATGRLDGVDRQLLSLVATMFVALKVALSK